MPCFFASKLQLFLVCISHFIFIHYSIYTQLSQCIFILSPVCFFILNVELDQINIYILQIKILACVHIKGMHYNHYFRRGILYYPCICIYPMSIKITFIVLSCPFYQNSYLKFGPLEWSLVFDILNAVNNVSCFMLDKKYLGYLFW